MFVNLTNHPFRDWTLKQQEAAKEYGEVTDYPFPLVPPEFDKKQVNALAERVTNDILQLSPDIVCCQGEMTLTYSLVNMLKEHGIKVVAACSERNIIEKKAEGGRIIKTTEFNFVKFREY